MKLLTCFFLNYHANRLGISITTQGHKNTVTTAKWWHKPLTSTNSASTSGEGESRSEASNIATYIISAGLDGLVFFWLIDGQDARGRRVRRQETPNWAESDVCQICSAPFFWNIKKMWNDMSVGVRQVSYSVLITIHNFLYLSIKTNYR